jgi:hypothetical protein
MKSRTCIVLISAMLFANLWATLDIAQAPLAMDLTADLEERILKEAKRELTGKLYSSLCFLF